MRRVGLMAMICVCSCQPKPGAGSSEVSNQPFVPKANASGQSATLVSSEEANVVAGAMEEFYTNRWPQWNVGDFVGLEPSWVNGQFDDSFFDKALDFWIIKFGNDGAPSEGTLSRIRETLVANASPPASGNPVAKGMQSYDFGSKVVLVPTSYFDQTADWVPGAVQFKSPSGSNGSIRVTGAVSYPLFSGDHHYAFLQMNHVKYGAEKSQLHFFLEKQGEKWVALAVGRIPE